MKRTILKTLIFAMIIGLSSISLAAPKSGAKVDVQRIEGLSGVVNINSANADQLSVLPRIGPSKAKRIIAYRQKRPFKHTYEIIRVKGIGRKTFKRLKPYLSVSGQTTIVGKKKSKKKASKKS